MSVISVNADNFESEVLQSTTPVLLDFSSGWCVPCRMVAPILEEIAAERSDVKVCKLDIDESPMIAAQYRVMSIPTLMLFQNGQPLRTTVGASPKAEILEFIG